MGRVPVYIYDDLPWMPYLGTEACVTRFGYLGGLFDRNHTLKDLVREMKLTSQEEYDRKLERVRSIRPLFTYEGVLQQFELFLNDPFGARGGYLVCTVRYPKSAHCCS